MIISWAGLCVRLFQVQILNGHQYQSELKLQSQKKQFIHANRGNIYDRKRIMDVCRDWSKIVDSKGTLENFI